LTVDCPCILTIEPNTANMEKVLITANAANVLTVDASGRGYEGSGAKVHASGVKIELLYVATNITELQTAVNTLENQKLNDITAPDGDVSMNTHKLTGVVDPTADQEAATKKYVDDTALPVAGGTMSGDIQLGETDIKLDAALSADGKWSGIVEAGTAGAILAFGDLCYFAVADSKWELTDADAEATTFGKLGICVLAAAEDAATEILLWGKVRADAVFPTFTIGAPVFVDVTAGDVSNTAPSGNNDCVRIVGYGNTGDELFFCPSPDWYEIAI